MATPDSTENIVSDAQPIAIIGAGNVGAPTAVLLAHFGHSVIVAERDESRRTMLQKGRSPIVEEGLESLLRSTQSSGHLRFVADASAAVRSARFVFLCVATPMGSDGNADLSELDDAVSEIRLDLRDDAIVVDKSTVPVGTAERVAQRIGRPGISIVSNPEFLREGSSIKDSFGPSRTVVGSNDCDAALAVGALFESTGAPLVVCDARTAELIKYAANAFLSAKLSFINSMSQLCDTLGADVAKLAEGMGHDPRIGHSFLTPGPGWGGPCLPKDASALLAFSREASVDLPIVRASLETNASHMDYIVDRIRDLVDGNLRGVKICALGLTFKSHTGDRRNSPAIAILTELIGEGTRISAYDPTVVSGQTPSDLEGMSTFASALDAARGARLIVVLTEWPEFMRLNWKALGEVMEKRVVFDTRRVIDADLARTSGFVVLRLGSSSPVF